MPNLRVVQWQAYQRKRNRLEFLVPWWDLQHGCSINQFLSAFAAKNADFRCVSCRMYDEHTVTLVNTDKTFVQKLLLAMLIEEEH